MDLFSLTDNDLNTIDLKELSMEQQQNLIKLATQIILNNISN